MKKTILFTTALIYSLSILSAQPRNANRNFQKPGQGFQGKSPIALSLTDEQKEQLKDLRLQHIKNTLEIKNELGVLVAEYKGLTTGDNQSLKEIDKNIDERQSLRSDLMKMNSGNRLEVRGLLTEEQKIIFDSRKSNRKHFKGNQKTRRNRPGMQRPNRPGNFS